MARAARTRFAILGMLTAGEQSGYDLKRSFEERVGYFWAESVGQIYPTLRALRSEGLVRARPTASMRGPGRTVYEITDEGRAAFVAWMHGPPAPDTVRNELLLKIFFGARVEPTVILDHITRYEEHQREQRVLFDELEGVIDEVASSSEERLYWQVALSSGKHVNRARLAWCRHARRLIEQSGLAAARVGGVNRSDSR